MKTSEAKFLLVFRGGRRCGICGKKIKYYKDVTVDHIVPLDRGGKNVIMNYQLAHEFCNVEKGNLLPEEYTYLKQHRKYRAIKCFLERLFLRRPKLKSKLPPELHPEESSQSH